MAKYVCNGATMRCAFGSGSANLTVLPARRILVENQPMASIMDFAPFANIAPFGNCMTVTNPMVAAATTANSGVLSPQPCIPAPIMPWTPGKPTVLLAGEPALMDFCTTTCMWGGVITVAGAGQGSTAD